MTTPNFNQDDVWKVARALLEWAVSHDVSHGRMAVNECNHCDARIDWREPDDKIQHKPDCPVLAARDLLTGAPPANI